MVVAITRKDAQGTPLVEGATVTFHTTPTHTQEGTVREVRFDDVLVDSGKITWTLPHRLVTVKRAERPWYEDAGVVTPRQAQDWKGRLRALKEALAESEATELLWLRQIRVSCETGEAPVLGIYTVVTRAREAFENTERIKGELDALCGGAR
jgi:hypothetical protein